MTSGMAGRTVHPYDDTDLIDSRAPRTNQAVIGSLALLAFLLDLEWLPGVLALQLAVGLTLGRRYCLPCLLYFEVLQPRFGEGRVEDARPPRFANLVGVCFLGGATLAFLLGTPWVGWALTLVVAALALLAAASGLCLGCEMYLALARLRGLRVERYPVLDRVDPGELGLGGDTGVGVVGFSSPYCLPCREWESALERTGISFSKVDVANRPDLARRYHVQATPRILAVRLPGGDVLEAFGEEPHDEELRRLRELSTA
jgi:Domain of unknown function (DUF4395)/Thioredoxin